jgi:AcrR family transcriptional regulator
MTDVRARPYHSPIRQQQADETRRRILDAARVLLLDRGYDGTTIENVARDAGVSPQTVYAAFGSKRGILAGLLDRARFGSAFFEMVELAKQARGPVARLRLVAAIARRVYDAERSELDLLRGAGALLSPDLAALDREHEQRRLTAQAATIDLLARSGRLRPDLDAATAGDIVWSLTGREMYRMLVADRGWASERYETWLAETLISSLLVPGPDPEPATAGDSEPPLCYPEHVACHPEPVTGGHPEPVTGCHPERAERSEGSPGVTL